MPTYDSLRVTAEIKRLTVMVYHAVREFPTHERFGLTGQMTRAALSVGCNTVEGQRRGTTKDFRHFVHTAEGSLAELQYCLEIAKELGYLSQDVFAPVWAQSLEVERMLRGLRLGLERAAAVQ